MKKLLILFAAVLSLATACQQKEEDVEVTGILINTSKLILEVGESDVLTAIILPSNATVKPEILWSSKDASIASVTDGKVTALKQGNTRIIAKTSDGKFSVSCDVTVFLSLNSLTLSPSEVSMYVGDTEKLTVTLDPEDASVQDVEWSSSNPDIAKVSAGKVTAVAVGEATITAESIDGEHSATCLVKVIGEKYSNPVCATSLPDPSCIKVGDTFYLYATEDTRNVPIMTSKDLVKWTQQGTVFTESSRPNFISGGGVWAPDINIVGGKYVLYFSMGNPSVDYNYGIGAAYANSPLGPWTLAGGNGQLMTDATTVSYGYGNCIDPEYFEYGGKKYLYYGSFHSINYVELSSDGLSLASGAKPTAVAGSKYEGSYLHKHGDYWYLFASRGTWGVGSTNTYTVAVGRSTSPFGPFVNKRGESMLDNKDEVVIESGNNFVATGHNGEIFTDSEGTDWMIYHAQRKGQTNSTRSLMLSRIEWVDGWPTAPDSPDESNVVAPKF